MKKVTKKQFNDAYNKHLPNAWIRFAFKYFSKKSENSDMRLNNIITIILVILFGVGFFGTIFNVPQDIILTATTIYSIILFVLVSYLFSAVFMNNRIKKIRKLLNINKEEYSYYVLKYYKGQ